MQQTVKGSEPGTSIGWIAFASSVGTTIEWYDFFLYGVVTPIVLNKLFFPNFDALAGTLLAYTTSSSVFSRVRSGASSSATMGTVSVAKRYSFSRS